MTKLKSRLKSLAIVLALILSFGLIGIFTNTQELAAKGVKVSATFHSYPNELRVSFPNGQYARYYNSVSVIKTEAGRIVFCIEPFVDVSSEGYLTRTPENEKLHSSYGGDRVLTPDKLHKVEMAVYHGWNTSSKSIGDYTATKMAIFNIIWDAKITGLTKADQAKFDAIHSKIKTHGLRPNLDAKILKQGNTFENNTLKIKTTGSNHFIDTNGIISKMEVVQNTTGAKISISNNNLYVSGNKDTKDGKVTFVRWPKVSTLDASILYFSPSGGQKAVETADPDHVTFTLNISVEKEWNINVSKVDAETKTAQADASLAGAVYGLYKVDANGKEVLLDKYTTDENASFSTKNYVVKDGTTIKDYFIREISPSKGYNLNNKKYYLKDATTAGSLDALEVEEDIIKGNIQILKYTEDGLNKEVPEEGAEFEVYLKSSGSYEQAKASERDKLVADSRGYATSKALPYGTYVVRQTSTWPNSLLSDPFEVQISENNKTYTYTLHDDVFKSRLLIIKLDKDSGKRIPYKGAAFEIYTPSGEKLVQAGGQSVFYTDERGEILLPEALPYGEGYSLKEVKAPLGYVLDTEDISFDINKETAKEDVDGNLVVKIYKPNQVQKGKIKLEKTAQAFTSVKENNAVYTPIYEDINLAGVSFEIYANEDIKSLDGTVHNRKGELVDSLTTDENGLAESKELYLGSYLIKEVEAPRGYVLDKEAKTVELKYAGQELAIASKSVEVHNDLQEIAISLNKVLEKDPNFNSSADLTKVKFGLYANEDIKAKDGSIIPKGGKIKDLSADANGQLHYTGKLPFGAYYLLEEETASGYLLEEKAIEFSFEYQGQDVKTVELQLLNGQDLLNKIIRGSVKGLKLDSDTGAALENVVFGLFSSKDAQEASYSTSTDKEGKFSFTGIPYGKWYLKEISTIDGYILNKDVEEIVIDENDKVLEFTFSNEKNTTEIRKVDMAGTELSGAKIEVLTKDGKVLDKWTSTKEAHIIRGLHAGETYILRESLAPLGYVKSQDVEFTVNKDGSATKVQMKNELSTTEITKTDISGAELAGAKLELIDKDGKVVDAWTSTKEPHIIKGLHLGETYTLRETMAPLGYVKSQDVEFTVNKDGSVTKVSMQNELSTTEIKKTDMAGKELKDAKLEVLNKDGEIIDEWTSTDEAHTIRGLALGETYILRETIAPIGYVKAQEVEFTVNKDGSVSKVEMKNELSTTEVIKTDMAGAELAGAKLQVINKDGKLIDEWTSTKEAHVIRGLHLGESYTLREILPPLGYVKSQDVEFTINEDGSVTKVQMKNELSTTEVTKTDMAGKELAGAKLQVLDKDGKLIDEWISTEKPHIIRGLHLGETYTLKETMAPLGYIKSKDIEFTVNKDGSVTKVSMKNELSTTEITKTDMAVNELAGAKLQVINKDGKIIDEWTSTKKPHVIRGLHLGETYTLKESLAPIGYVKSQDVKFTVKADGTVTKVSMKNELSTTKISKIDMAGAELAGAKLQVINKNGKVVDEWTSGHKEHFIKGLHLGETYTLRESMAPLGYVKSQDVEFTVNKDGSVTKVKMKNELSTTEVKKTDMVGAELAGAKLQVIDKGGKVVDEWTSTKQAHVIRGLHLSESYTLKETLAPLGYVKSKKVEFTVNKNGSVTKVQIQNELSTTEIRKTDMAGTELAGAKLKVIDKEGKVIDEWTSSKQAHVIRGLHLGESYTLKETLAPLGYVKSKAVQFTVNKDGTVTKVQMKNELSTTKITKTDLGGTELAGAKLEVINKDGKVVDAWTSTKEAHVIRGLHLGESYVLRENLAPLGYVKSQDFEFTVNKDGSVTKVSMSNELSTTEISKTDMAGAELPGAKLEVISKDGKVIDEWISSEKAHIIRGLHLGETYTLKETLAPAGYLKAETVEFTVNKDGSVTKVQMKDELSTTEISKTDIAGTELAGAKLEVLNKDGEVVDEWISTEEEHIIRGLHLGETYTLKETIAPEGYVKAQAIEFTVNTDGSVTKVQMKNELSTTEISKTDIFGDELAGAKLEIIDEEGKVVDEWVSTDKAHIIRGLHLGKSYRLRETIAPLGYVKAEEIEFTVNEDASVTAVEMRNELSTTKITKTDSKGNVLVGAKMQILSKDGEVIYEWISGNKAYVIRGLHLGETYTLKEIAAPAGYVKSQDFEFKVNKDGTVTEVAIVNERSRTEITKTDMAGKELKGAKLQVLNRDGEVIDEWISGKKAHVIEGLNLGETYILRETMAPKGYQKAEDVEFTVNKDGSVTKVQMLNELKPKAKTGENISNIFTPLALISLATVSLFIRKKRRYI